MFRLPEGGEMALFLCFALFCWVQTLAKSSSSVADVERVLDDLLWEWSRYSITGTPENFTDCLEATLEQSGWYFEGKNSSRLLFSPVCERRIRRDNLIKVRNFCRAKNFFRNLSTILSQQSQNATFQLRSVSFTDAGGDFQLSYIPAPETTHKIASGDSYLDLSTPSCIPDPRQSQVFISTSSTPQLLVVLNLLGGERSEVRGLLEALMKVTSQRNDYIAFLSKPNTTMRTGSYETLIQRADRDAYLSLINATFDDKATRDDEPGDEWVERDAVLNLLVRNISHPAMPDIPCDAVLMVLLRMDLSTALSDVLSMALSWNRNLRIVVYRFPLVQTSLGVTPMPQPGFTNLRHFLCNGRTWYEDISSRSGGTLDSWNIFSLVGLQDFSRRQPPKWYLGEESVQVCGQVLQSETNPLLQSFGKLKILSGMLCLEINSTINETSAPTNFTDASESTTCGSNDGHLQGTCQWHIFRQRFQQFSLHETQHSLYSTCPSSNCSLLGPLVLDYISPILNQLSSALVQSSHLVAPGIAWNATACPRNTSTFLFSCSSQGQATPLSRKDGFHVLSLYDYYHSSIYFANNTVENVVKFSETDSFEDVKKSLCMSSYLDDLWASFQYFLPQVTFQYIDYEHRYARFYPGHQASNLSCLMDREDSFSKLLEEEQQEFFTSVLTGKNMTSYCQEVYSSARHNTSYPSGKLCMNIPVAAALVFNTPENRSSTTPSATPINPSLKFKENNKGNSSLFNDQSLMPTSTNFDPLTMTSEFQDMDLIDVTSFLEDSEDILISYSSSSMSPSPSTVAPPAAVASETASRRHDLFPTPSPNVTRIEALSFKQEVEQVLKNVSSRVRGAYIAVVSSLASGNENCPFGVQLRDTCQESCEEMFRVGSGEEEEALSCRNVLGECQPWQEGNSIYAPVDLDDLLSEYNYSLSELQQQKESIYKRLCVSQSLFSTGENSDGVAAWSPFSGYYVDSHTGLMSFLADSPCSPRAGEDICLTREFDPRRSHFYRSLLVDSNDVYFVVQIDNEANFDGMQRAAVEFVRLVPKLQELYFQAKKTSNNFERFTNDQTFEMGNQRLIDTVSLIKGEINNITDNNITIVLMMDTCLTNEELSRINYLSSKEWNVQTDIFIYTFGNLCMDTSLERHLACRRNGEWRRIRNESSIVQMQNDDDGSSARDIIMSYLKLYSTNFYFSNETVVWRGLGIENSSWTENRTISSCVTVPVPMSDEGEHRDGEDSSLLGFVCIEFDRESVNSLEGSEMVIRDALAQGKVLTSRRMLTDEERDSLRVNKCNIPVIPTNTEPPPITDSPPSPTTPSGESSSGSTRSQRKGKRRMRLSGGQVAAIVLGFVAFISGIICVGYWIFTACHEYTRKRRRYYKSKDAEDDPFSTNYKRLHENMTQETQ